MVDMSDASSNVLTFLDWIRLVEIPVIGAFVLAGIHHIMSDFRVAQLQQADMTRLEADIKLAKAEGAKELAEYRLSAMREFATVGNLAEVEKRLTSHLDRIEEKLDKKG